MYLGSRSTKLSRIAALYASIGFTSGIKGHGGLAAFADGDAAAEPGAELVQHGDFFPGSSDLPRRLSHGQHCRPVSTSPRGRWDGTVQGHGADYVGNSHALALQLAVIQPFFIAAGQGRTPPRQNSINICFH